MYGRGQNRQTFQSVYLKERDHFGDLGIDGRLNIKRDVK
jgi:hypothetical protein